MDITLKILILGDSNVGKTSLLLTYADNYFPDSHVATIGIDYKIKEVEIDGLKLKLQIWDTSGQERFRSMTHTFLRSANGIAFVYDITNKKSFEGVKNWIKDAESNNPGFEKVLIGNKTDLEMNRVISKDEAQKYSENHNFNYFSETSAKNGFNAKEVFIQAAKVLYLEHLRYKNRGNNAGNINYNNINSNNNNNNIPITINKDNLPKRKKVRCC